MIIAPIITRDPDETTVPNGSSGGIFGFIGKLFVPSGIVEDWKANDEMIRERAQKQASSTEVQARIANDADMAKSAQNVRAYISMPFIGDTFEREVADDTLTALAESAASAPKTLLNYVADNVIEPAAGGIGRAIKNLVPWQVWIILGIAAIIAVFIYLPRKS